MNIFFYFIFFKLRISVGVVQIVSKCPSFINKSECEFCIYHVQNEFKKSSAKRSEIQSSFSGTGLSTSKCSLRFRFVPSINCRPLNRGSAQAKSTRKTRSILWRSTLQWKNCSPSCQQSEFISVVKCVGSIN